MADDENFNLTSAVSEALDELSGGEQQAVEAEQIDASVEENLTSEETSEEVSVEEQEITQEDEQGEIETGEKPAIQPPVSWAADKKQLWEQLPPETREYISQRESERDRYLEQKSRELSYIKQEYNAIDSAFAGLESTLSSTNLTKPQAVQELVSLYKLAERDPVGYVQLFAQSKGLDLQQLAEGRIDQTQVQARTALQKINQLESELYQLKNGKQEETNSYLEQEVARFSSDPQNKYFEQVKEDMALLIENGKAQDLADAYELACRLNPQVFEAIQKEKALKEAAQRDAKAKAAKKAAGVSMKTSGVSGVSKPAGDGSLADTIRDALDELSGGVAA